MTKKSIFATLEVYAKAYCQKDISSLMSVFANSDNISVIGTGGDELCIGREEIRSLFQRNFNEATAQKFEWNWYDIIISGDHAVVAATLTIHIEHRGKQVKVPLRWTIVLKNNNEQWLWIHRNASIADSKQNAGNAYPETEE